jgi:hypothetical protein
MLPVPITILAMETLPDDAPEVKQASVGFVHGLLVRYPWRALAMPLAGKEEYGGRIGLICSVSGHECSV